MDVDECIGYDDNGWFIMNRRDYEEYYGEHVGTCKIHGSVLGSCSACEEVMEEEPYEEDDVHYCIVHHILHSKDIPCGLCQTDAHTGRKLC